MENAIDIAKHVLKLEADSIYVLMNRLDSSFQKALDLIMQQNGRVLVLGLGKSGHIGKKIAATLASTGQPAFFIHPTEAAHGDLGMMMRGDICLMISHSGNTLELLETIPAIKRIGLPIISITSNPNSKLVRYSDIVLKTYVQEEACPFNLAPTSSTTVTLAYGDAIAICLLKLRGLKKEQFAMCHPGGVLGKRLLIKVSDIMINENLPINNEKDTFKQALVTMTKGKQGATIIVDNRSKCVGILTDGDLRRALEKYDKVSEIELERIFVRNPKKISPHALAVEALQKMQNNKITSLIVVNEEDQIVGLIHIHHLLEQGF
ncbi:MAG: KpsF/GutQ family sugar-phosphate isomerase [Thermodesulfobacteriota bacterium]|nr:KpsF/GutQ family sugar-phosphate isomerase [Thermodesulfobacteriota bacterium]